MLATSGSCSSSDRSAWNICFGGAAARAHGTQRAQKACFLGKQQRATTRCAVTVWSIGESSRHKKGSKLAAAVTGWSEGAAEREGARSPGSRSTRVIQWLACKTGPIPKFPPTSFPNPPTAGLSGAATRAKTPARGIRTGQALLFAPRTTLLLILLASMVTECFSSCSLCLREQKHFLKRLTQDVTKLSIVYTI